MQDNQKLTNSDKPTEEVTLLVKSSIYDVTSSLVKSTPKSVKDIYHYYQFANGITVTKRLVEIYISGTITPHSEIPGIGKHKVGLNQQGQMLHY